MGLCRRCWRLPTVVLMLCLLPGGMLLAAPNSAQQAEIARLQAEIDAAVSHIQAAQFDQALARLRAAQSDFDRLAGGLVRSDREAQAAIEPLVEGLAIVRSRLLFEGLEVPQPGMTPDGGLPDRPANAPADPPALPGAAVSFSRQVAPLLVQKCGGCHINESKGDFAMRSFSELLGSGMVDAGDSQGSRLLEVIRTGDMPRGGGKVAARELATLAAWVDQGAKFDGSSETVNLRELGQPAVAAAGPAAIGDGELRFSTHVAPILVANCMNCHGQNNPRGDYGVNTFARLMAGGENGAAVVPGNAAMSLLVRKLKGTADGARMPMGQSPLPDEQVATIEKWIAAGAKFDGPDQRQDLEQVAALGIAINATHEQLSDIRADMADANWRLSIPDESATTLESENFLVLGNVPREQLEALGKLAEQQAEKIGSLLQLPADEPLLKGRITLYAFKQRFDYSEFATMAERRRLPREVNGHWRYTVVDGYVALVPPGDDGDVSLAALLAEQIAGVTLAARTSAPGWFSTGTARVIAARLDPEDPRIEQWQDRLPEVLARLRGPDEFLEEQLPAEDQAVLSYDLVQAMMKNAGRYRKLMDELRKGTEFAAAVQQVYGAEMKVIVTTWIQQGGSKR